MASESGEARSRGAYHHGDLRAALVAAAAAIIAEEGADALTLRGVGNRVGVSRTALYRHFADKAALLATVATEGFRMLRSDLEEALLAAGSAGGDPMVALSAAYIRFGSQHPPHYRTMFGPALMDKECYPDLAEAGEAAFAVLVGAIAAGQADGRFVPSNPARIAQVFWSTVHGIVMLGGNGRFQQIDSDSAAGPSLGDFAATILLQGLVVR